MSRFLKNGRYLVIKIYRSDPSIYQSGSGTPKFMPHRTKDTVYADNGCSLVLPVAIEPPFERSVQFYFVCKLIL